MAAATVEQMTKVVMEKSRPEFLCLSQRWWSGTQPDDRG